MKNLVFCLLVLLPQPVLANCREAFLSAQTIDPTDKTPWDITSRSYLTSKSSSFVFIISPIVGETFLDRRLARKLCAQGINAVIANVVKQDDALNAVQDLNIHNNAHLRALAGIKSLMAKVEETHSVARFGILGMSLGGMLSAFIAGSESRIEATVLVAGAGNAAGVLAYSDQKIVKSQREQRYKVFNVSTPGEYEDLLRPFIPDDPLTVAKNIRANSAYLFIANNDTTVPSRYQKELRSAIDSPLVYSMNVEHTQALVRAGTIHAGKIVNFFKLRLN